MTLLTNKRRFDQKWLFIAVHQNNGVKKGNMNKVRADFWAKWIDEKVVISITLNDWTNGHIQLY